MDNIITFVNNNYNKINYEVFRSLHDTSIYKKLKKSGLTTKETDIAIFSINIYMFLSIISNN
jgi:hypothetical protein